MHRLSVERHCGNGCQEPYEPRGSRTESVGDWRCDSSGLPGIASMLREKSKWRTHKDENTDARRRGGWACRSEEAW